MSNKGQMLQDPFLNTLRKEHVPVSIYLVNGIKLQGPDRIVRPVRRAAEEHGHADGVQARDFHLVVTGALQVPMPHRSVPSNDADA